MTRPRVRFGGLRRGTLRLGAACVALLVGVASAAGWGCKPIEHPCPLETYYPAGEIVESVDQCPSDTCPLDCGNGYTDACVGNDLTCEECEGLQAFIDTCVGCVVSTTNDGATSIYCQSTQVH